ncbi:MAG: hypothetical protein WA892_14795 [Ornithinimicrobium sp.]
MPTDTREALISLNPDDVRFIGGPAMLEDPLMDDVRDFLSPTRG